MACSLVSTTAAALSCGVASSSTSSSSSSSLTSTALSSTRSSFVSLSHFRGRNSEAVCLHSGSSFTVECSSRSQKKCTAHHNKSRPKKHNPYDKNRKPAVYPKPPKAPPIISLGWGDEGTDAAAQPVSAQPALVEA